MAGDAAAMRFSCDSCGKSYAWKQELAGKKAKCKCGAAISVPTQLGGADDDAGAYDLADAGPAPAVAAPRPAASARPAPVARPAMTSSGRSAPVAAAAAPAGALPRATASGRMLNYKSAPTRGKADREKDVFFNRTKDVFIPLGMLMFGVLMTTLAFMFEERLPIVWAMTATVVALGLEVVFLVAASFVVARITGVSFGTLWIGILKLATLVCFCSGLDTGVSWLAHGTGIGGLLGWAAFTLSYFFLLMWLFDMDPGEAWLVFIIISVLKFLFNTFLMIALIGLLFSGAGGRLAGAALGGGGGGGGGGTMITGSASSAAAQQKEVDALKESGSLMEAREFVGGGRQAAMKQLVEDLYGAGAKKAYYSVNRQPNTGKIEGASDFIVELPDDPAARKKCFELINAWRKTLEQPAANGEPAITYDPLTDDGDPYLFMELP
jgi:hypothetical protein